MATAPATCAAGQKLSVTHQTAIAGVVIPMTNVMTPLTAAQIFSTFKTDYCGNIIYENGNVSRILTEEGYITFSGTTPVYHYYLKDHQGNNRVVINQSGTVEQVNHYYPFGGLMGESTAGGVQPYKYNGKELDRMHGLDLFDYGARHYDAAIGRWWTVDPLAEKYYSISPYVYCKNNPVRFVDPNGMWYDDYIVNHEKKHIERIKTTDKTDRIFDGSNLKGTIVEKGEFNVEEYKNQGYSVNTVVASGMAITDLGLSVLGGEMAFAKIGAWIGKGISALRTSGAAKAAEAGVEVGANAAKTGTTVLGHYPQYVKVAETIGARTFQIPTKIWNKMTPAQQWGANQKFLDRMILRGDNIRLATPLNQVKPGSFYQKELNYLFDKGYKVSSDGLWLVK